MKLTVGILTMLLMLISCRDDYVITDTAPFFDARARLDRQRIDQFVAISERFASTNNLGINVNWHDRAGGRFSVVIYNRDFNIIALNEISQDEVRISGIARGTLTDRDRTLMSIYLRSVNPAIMDLENTSS